MVSFKDLAAKLQAQLENARKLKESSAHVPARESAKEVRELQLLMYMFWLLKVAVTDV